MASWDDVRRIALALPETSERPAHGNTAWRVRDKVFVWERPLRPADLRALGGTAPAGPILGVRVEHLGLALDTGEPVLEDVSFVRREAQAEADLAYEHWDARPSNDTYAVYRAAQDRADAAQDDLAAWFRSLAA